MPWRTLRVGIERPKLSESCHLLLRWLAMTNGVVRRSIPPSLGPKLAWLVVGCLLCPSQIEAAPAPDQSCTQALYCKDLAGRGISDWTHIVWIGPQTYPQPIIWLSRDRLKLLGFPETNVVLSASQYRGVEHIAINGYTARPVRSSIDGIVGAFRITQKMRSRKPRTYFLSAVDGCRYMADIISLKGINWMSSRNRAPFLEYKTICDIAGQPLP